MCIFVIFMQYSSARTGMCVSESYSTRKVSRWGFCETIKETFVRYLFDSRWSDRRETLQVNTVGHEHENKVRCRLHFAN